MRKIIASINVTLDGFMAGPENELDWHFNLWTEEMEEWLGWQLATVDTILLGRITYNAMAAYWPACGSQLDVPRGDIAFAGLMNNYMKVVVSNSADTIQWNNTLVIQRNVLPKLRKMKTGAGKDMMIFGSGTLVSGLIAANLVDEYILWVHPVILGKGRPFFTGIDHVMNMRLISTRVFRSGVVAFLYAAA